MTAIPPPANWRAISSRTRDWICDSTPLSDRRQQLIEQRITAVNRLHQLLAELLPGGADRRLTPAKALQLLSSVRPRDQVGKARKQLALAHAGDVERLDGELTAIKASISKVLAEHPSQVSAIRGVGAVLTALILGEVRDVRRFPARPTSPATPAPRLLTPAPVTTFGTG
jgi:transposase